MNAAVRMDAVTFGYGDQAVLRNVSFAVESGAFMALVGANGCGKSTLMRLLLGLLQPQSGRVELLGETPAVPIRRGRVGYVPQRDSTPARCPLSGLDMVMLGRCGRLGLGRRPKAADRALALEAMAIVGADGLAESNFGELSGGQQRLVLVARALAQEPDLLLMDEADTGLDAQRRQEVYEALNALRLRRHLTIVAISHQYDLLATMVGQACSLRDGVIEDWCPEHMTHSLARHDQGEPWIS